MLSEEENSNIKTEIEAKKKELSVLLEKLKELHQEKEAWFEKKKQVTQQIGSLSKTIREAKGKRNTFTKQVRDSKSRRDELNTQIKKKVGQLKKLIAEKKRVTQQFGFRIDPIKVKEEMDQLDFKIETEALPFRIEQQIMRQVAEKKRMLEQMSEVSDIFANVSECQKELRKLRKKADETHKKVQTKAGESQSQHEELIETSKGIQDLRDNETAALKKFVEVKKLWTEQKDKVDAKQDEINLLRRKTGEVVKEEKKKQDKADNAKIAETKKDVEEKIKKKMKLTTEDLLAFQADSGKKRK